MSLQAALFVRQFWAALICIPLSAIAAQSSDLINLAPNQPLAMVLNVSPNNADMLWFGDNTPLSTTGLPSITGQLFNNGNLLGTFTQIQTGYFAMAFESLASQYTPSAGIEFGILPTRVDFSSLNEGTTTGCLFVTVTGGSVSLNPDAFAYDSMSSSPNSALGGLSAEMYWSIPPAAPSINAMVNAASYGYGAGLAPGSIASVYGNFSQICPAAAASSPLPTSLSGLSMQFGNQAPAPLFYTSSQQVNLQIPLGTGKPVADDSGGDAHWPEYRRRDLQPCAILARNLLHEFPGYRPGRDPGFLLSPGRLLESGNTRHDCHLDLLHRPRTS